VALPAGAVVAGVVAAEAEAVAEAEEAVAGVVAEEAVVVAEVAIHRTSRSRPRAGRSPASCS
jgi:hypothetical protein